MPTRELFFANRFVDSNTDKVNQMFAPHFHLYPPIGWINDPNGFSVYGGRTRMFCQYYPYDATWGPMHWGEWSSIDMIHWKWEGVVIAPEEPYDNFGCFSGTAIDDGDRMVIMYTGVHLGEDGMPIQEQCIAESRDGVHFTKWDCNPVISRKDLPADAVAQDFRDPKLMKTDDGYRCIVANRNETTGRLLCYTSKDLKNWKYEGIFCDGLGTMAECPDYSPLDGRGFLISCAMHQPMEGYRYQNNHHAVLGLIGDEKDNRLTVETRESIDLGPDFYAPEMTRLPDGRLVTMAWMHMWGENAPTDYLGHCWSGQYTFPRELHIRDGRLYQQPIREIEAFYNGDVYTCAEAKIEGLTELDGLTGRRFDMEMDIEVPEDGSAEIRLMENFNGRMRKLAGTYFSIRYDAKEKAIHTDRSHTGLRLGWFGGIEEKAGGSANWSGDARKLHLRILADTASVELFVGEGELAMTTLAFPVGPSDHIAFNGNFTVKNLVKHEIH